MKAAEKYDKTQGVKFSTYAYYWARKYILGTLDKEIKTSKAESKYNYKKYENSVEKEALTIHKMEQLNEQEQKILKLHAEGHTQEEIGKKIDLTQGRISQILS